MENLNKKSWLSENAKSILIVVGFIVLWIILRILGLIFKRWPLYFILHGLNNDVPYEKSQNIENNNVTFNDIKNNDSFFGYEKVNEENYEINNIVPFEKKEKCMKYYDNFKKELEKDFTMSFTGYFYILDHYEMFYNQDLDTCVSAYSFWGDDNGDRIYSYEIIDFLNGRETLFDCGLGPLDYIYGTTGGKENCKKEWEFEKERYKR